MTRARRRYPALAAVLLTLSAPLVPPGAAAAAPTQETALRPPRVERIALGGFAAPAPGVALRRSLPPGAPLSADVPPPTGPRSAARARPTLSVLRPAVPRFAAVAVTWARDRRGGGAVSVAARVRHGDTWTSWQAVGTAEPDERPGRDGADLLWFGDADGVELAVTSVSGPAPRDLAADLIDPGTLPTDVSPAPADPPAPGIETVPPGAQVPGLETAPPAEREATPAPPAQPEAAAAPAVPAIPPPRVPRPTVIRRAGWGANERQMTWNPEYKPWIRAATLHHTATTNAYSAADVPRILRSIYHYQAVSRGWGDIGYNVLVDRFGRIWEGRRGGLNRAVVGAHAGGFNSYTAGVALIGDHRSARPTAASLAAVARYMAWKFSLAPAADPRGTTTLTGGGSTSRYPPGTTVRVPRVFGHRTTNQTECPGNAAAATLPWLRTRVAALLGRWADPATIRLRMTVWRASTARWYARPATAPPIARGRPGNVPVAADYDGDGATDLATWAPSTGNWLIRFSASGTLGRLRLGSAGDLPVPADTDGDGRAEPMTFTPGTGLWHRRGRAAVRWGVVAGDVPLPADYSGDGRADIAVWRPSTGVWHLRGFGRITFGLIGQVPVPADYNGDGRVEPAVWSRFSHYFHARGQTPRAFAAGSVPVPGQYDGDVPLELAVWGVRGGRGRWVVEGAGTAIFGTQGDRPIPAS